MTFHYTVCNKPYGRILFCTDCHTLYWQKFADGEEPPKGKPKLEIISNEIQSNNATDTTDRS